MSFQERLQKIGLDEREIKVLSNFENTNRYKISDLQKIVKIPRTTLDRTIEELIKKGILVSVLENQGKEVEFQDFSKYAQDLKNRSRIIDKKIKLVESTEEMFQNEENNQSKPEIKYYQGKDGIKRLIWNTLKSKSILRVYTNAMRKEILDGNWLTDYCLEFVHRGLEDRVLCDSDHAKNSYQQYGGRKEYFLPVIEFYRISDERVIDSQIMSIRGETYIYDDIFAMYTWEDKILTGFEIKSNYLVNTQKSIFDDFWKHTSEKNSIDSYIESLKG